MPERRFPRLVGLYSQAIKEYCEALEWDHEKFKVCISDEGISHPDLYLEDPNAGIIDKLSQFLEPTNQSSIFIIWDEVGMGKSSIRDFVVKSLEEVEAYHALLITDPRLTPFQFLRVITSQLGLEIPGVERRQIRDALEEKLLELSEQGMHIVIWVDEAEKITKEVMGELRALSDLKTEGGTKACKLILSGTPRLVEKIEEYITKDPENVAAFDDRASLNTFRLSKWTAKDIMNYWRLLSSFCGRRNPFTPEAAETVYKISEGKPRTIAQVTKLVLNLKAMDYHMSRGSLEISSGNVLLALKGCLSEGE